MILKDNQSFGMNIMIWHGRFSLRCVYNVKSQMIPLRLKKNNIPPLYSFLLPKRFSTKYTLWGKKTYPIFPGEYVTIFATFEQIWHVVLIFLLLTFND